jgi:hypothetical protein
MMEKLKAILSDWTGWASVVAILLIVATAVSERIRKFLRKVVVEYVAANWRRFWYWATNKSFYVSCNASFTFPANMVSDQRSLDQFGDTLREKVSPEIDGQLSRGNLKIILSKIGKVAVEVSAESGQNLMEQLQGADGYVDDGTTKPGKTLMKIRTSTIVIQYREFKNTLGYLRQTFDEVRNQFARLVEGKLNNRQTVYLEVFFNQDLIVDRGVTQMVPGPDENVSVQRVKGMTSFGAQGLDAIIAYVPHYLVRETISDLMKRHGLIM